MNEKPLLSICIPTYNRADYLSKSLDSLVCLPEFSSTEVEVIISDNASTDGTKEIVKRYSDKYRNIYYYRNDENIKDGNFPTVIKLAHGTFRKFCNDTLIYTKDYLSYLLDNIKLYQNDRPFMFFPNHNLGKKQKDLYACNDINEFLRICSFYITWIGAFGFWENELLLVDDWFAGGETHLWQTKVLLEILSKKNKMIVLNKREVIIQNIQNKDIAYGLYNVFYKNYLKLISDKVAAGMVNQSCYKFLRQDLLLNFFSVWVVNYKINQEKYRISESDNNFVGLLTASYKHECYFILFLGKVRFYLYKHMLKNWFKR